MKHKQKIIKGFHAVKFMRAVRDQISQDIKDMSFEELRNYFAKRRLKLTAK